MALSPEQLAEVKARILQKTATETQPSSTLPPAAAAAKAKILATYKPQPKPEQPEEPSFLEKAAQTINKGYEKYKELPGVKQVGQAAGKVFGTAGEVIGGGIGAIGGAIKGAKEGTGIVKTVVQKAGEVSRATGEFGEEIGKEGAAAAPLGVLGKVPNVIMAGAQGYEGQKQLREGLKEGDTEKALSGGMNLGVAALGARGAMKTKGLLLDKSVFPGKPEAIKAKQRLEKATKIIEDATQYKARTGIQKRLGEKIVEARKYGKPEPKNPNRTLAEESLIPEIVKTSHGTRVFDTVAAQDQANTLVKAASEMTSAGLEHADPVPKHDLEALRDEAVNNVSDNNPVAERAQKKAISEFFDAEISRSGKMATSGKLEKMKQGLYDAGYTAQGDPARSETAGAYRKAANRLKTEIETKNPDYPNKESNAFISDIINARKYLKDIHGTQVRGSYFGKKMAGLVGAGAGRSTGIPILGDVIGYHIGSEIGDMVSDPTRKLREAGRMMEGTRRPSQNAQGRIYDAVRKIYEKRMKSPPQLGTGKPGTTPESKAIPLGGKLHGVQVDAAGNRIFGTEAREPLTSAETTVFRARSAGTEKSLRSGDFKIEDLKLVQGQNPNQFFLHRKGYSPTSISRQEATELLRAGMKIKGGPGAMAEALKEEIAPILKNEESGVTLNIDGTKYDGDKAIVTLYSESVPKDELSPERIQKILQKKGEVLKGGGSIKVGLFDMGNDTVSVDVNIATSNREYAKKIAQANNQQSYFDPKLQGDDRFVQTGGTGVQTISNSEIGKWIKRVANYEKYKGKGRVIDAEPTGQQSIFGKSPKGKASTSGGEEKQKYGETFNEMMARKEKEHYAKNRKVGGTRTVYRGEKVAGQVNDVGTWVTENIDHAKEYGKVRKIEVANDLNILHANGEEAAKLADEFYKGERNDDIWFQPQKDFVEFLKKKGYDGFENGDNTLIFDKKNGSTISHSIELEETKGPKLNEPNPETAKVAEAYMKDMGVTDAIESRTDVPFDEARAKRIADAFEAMKDAPNSPRVKAAYKALADETKLQYNAIKKAGYKIEPWDKPGQPYKNSAEMVADVKNNKHLWFFKTDEGFGSGVSDQHPLLKESGVIINGHNLKYNDLFRAVHDFFGHTKLGNQFGPKGEEIAWREHSRMFSDEARRAMTTETRGQNSWTNFGKHVRDKNIPLDKRPYAEQKTGLLPDEFVFDTPKGITFGNPNRPMQNFIGKKAKTFQSKSAEQFPDKQLKNVIDADIKIKEELATWLKGFSWNVKQKSVQNGMSLREAIDYPELFSAYPSAKNIKIKVIDSDRIGGSTEVKDNGAVIIEIVKGRRPERVLETIKHELQHFIQAKEGWSRGGSRLSIYQPDVQHMTLLRMRNSVLANQKAKGAATVEDLGYIDSLIKKTGKDQELTPPEIIDIFGSGAEFDKYARKTYELLYGESEARGEVDPGGKYIFSKRDKYALDAILDHKKTPFGGGEKFVPLDGKFIDLLTGVMNRENGQRIKADDVAENIRKAYGTGHLTKSELTDLVRRIAPKAKNTELLVDEIKRAHSGQGSLSDTKLSETSEERRVKADAMYKKEYADLSIADRREVNKIIEMRQKGKSFQEIADELKISNSSAQFKYNQYSKGLTGKY